MFNLSIQKKIPLIFSLSVMFVGLLLVVFAHGWLYSIFQKERIKEVSKQIAHVKKITQVASQSKSFFLDLLVKNLHTNDIKENIFILDKQLNIVYPTQDEARFLEKKIVAKEFLARWNKKNYFLIQKKMAHINFFFEVEPKNQSSFKYYVLLERGILPENSNTFLLLLYLTILILSLLLWFISSRIVSRFFSIIFAVTHSLRYYSQNQYAQTIDYNKKDEIGELISAYNDLIEYLEELNHEEEPLISVPKSPPVSSSTNFENTSLPPKCDNLEISLFPRNVTEANYTVVFKKENESELHFLILETQEDHENATAWRERLRDNFIELVENNFESEEIIQKLFGSTGKSDRDRFQDSGFFYGNFNTENNEMSLFKTGLFRLYIKEPTQGMENLDIGFDELTNTLPPLVKKGFKPGSCFFLLTDGLLKSFGINGFDLEERIISSSNNDSNSSKEYLTEMLTKLYEDTSVLSVGDKPAGVLLVLLHKV